MQTSEFKSASAQPVKAQMVTYIIATCQEPQAEDPDTVVADFPEMPTSSYLRGVPPDPSLLRCNT